MFESHPSRLLSNHTIDVMQRVEEMVHQLHLSDHHPTWSKLTRIISACHDLGKYTSFFQRHLHGDLNVGNKSYHSLVGALFASYIVEELGDIIPLQPEADSLMPLIAYYVILQHHGHLIDFDTFFQFQKDGQIPESYNYLVHQIEDFKRNAMNIERDMQQYLPDLAPFFTSFIEEWREHIRCMRKNYLFNQEDLEDREEYDLALGIQIQTIFSLLIDADKHSASRNTQIGRRFLSAKLVDDYRNKRFKGTSEADLPMNQKRNLVNEIVQQQVNRLNTSLSFFTFTAPTGIGKTLSALEAALRLRERLASDGSSPRRIIYVLPYTSIIDQNYKIIEEVICPQRPDSSLVLKHHYLSELVYQTEGLENASLDRQLMFVESWESEIIVTTYVQLLETMLGTRNRTLKKQHNLASAIVILDEVQNMPFRYWQLTKELCKSYTSLFDNKWILLTATQPKIFSDTETMEWLESEQYSNTVFFQDMHRNEIELISEDYVDLDEWLTLADKHAREAKSVLMIANTILTSIEMFKYFQEAWPEKEVFYLSANMVFRHRRQVLREVNKRLKAGVPVALVATQVVEAGVDLDFHCVIRDLGPMDSIIQAAGRCNRHSHRKDKPDKVLIIPLKKLNSTRSDSAMVYGIDANISKQTLIEFQAERGGAIPEFVYQRMVDHYYRRLQQIKVSDESIQRLKQMHDLQFSQLADFSLISQNKKTYPVFVQYDCKAVALWNYYVEQVCKEENVEKRRVDYLRIKSRMQEYQLDVDLRYLSSLVPEYGFIVIRYEWIKSGQYYHTTTGWIRDAQDEGVFLI